jgi:subtilisin family serine protease
MGNVPNGFHVWVSGALAATMLLDMRAAASVHVYVIDTGVRKTHHAFAGRADWVGDFVSGTPGSPDAADCDPPPSPGHGTHVASIVAARAPLASIHALRILPCTGTTRTDYDAAVRAVDWIGHRGRTPAVVNMSAARWDTEDGRLDAAIRRSIAGGFTYVVSAGGMGNIDKFTPQRVPGVITVASTNDAGEPTQTGWGPRLTLFAPGVKVPGAGSASDTATFEGDGDSYAAAFVSGAAARFLQEHPHATASDVAAALLARAHDRVLQREAGR